jgi:hypothetical protein
VSNVITTKVNNVPKNRIDNKERGFLRKCGNSCRLGTRTYAGKVILLKHPRTIRKARTMQVKIPDRSCVNC